VAVFPSDHFILDEARFMQSVGEAVEETRSFSGGLTLLGMTPDTVEEGYGWIEAAHAEPGRATRAVRQFWEKPPSGNARTLLRRGALNGSGVREAARVLRLSPTTVIAVVKKSRYSPTRQPHVAGSPSFTHRPPPARTRSQSG
jgi:mannose-1-phosphate guanylyltransferase